METGIFIRAMIGNKAESIDIGDPRLSTEQLLRWLATLEDDVVLRTMDKVRECFAAT